MIQLSHNHDVAEAAHPMRTAVRFPLQLRARVQTENGPVDATTEDISATGVLFNMPFAPEVNSALMWTLQLPGSVLGAVADVTVTCVGRVVWHAPAKCGRWVGAVIDRYRMGDTLHV